MSARQRLPGGVKPPVAMVKKPRLRKLGPVNPGLRRGRGFSLGELRQAGLTPEKARKLGLYIDRRRRSIHPWNVEALKKYIEDLERLGAKA